MLELKIAITLIEQGNNFVLQQRDNAKHKGAAGMIGCFGGQLEGQETSQEAALRELTEETSLKPNIDELERIGKLEVNSDKDEATVRVKVDAFRLMVDDNVRIEAVDGSLVVLPTEQAASYVPQMTPATQALFKEFIFKE
ncbi:MAG TPA: NUDIX domain-containing protein [Patescibacteria group bacterium]|nr:NUDIX domain-containing protein [Patescibacteria group bacterium]